MSWRKRQSEYDRIHRRMSRLFGFIFGAIQGAVLGLLISLAVKTFQVFFPGDTLRTNWRCFAGSIEHGEIALGGLTPHRDAFAARQMSLRAGRESQFVTRRVTATFKSQFLNPNVPSP